MFQITPTVVEYSSISDENEKTYSKYIKIHTVIKMYIYTTLFEPGLTYSVAKNKVNMYICSYQPLALNSTAINKSISHIVNCVYMGGEWPVLVYTQSNCVLGMYMFSRNVCVGRWAGVCNELGCVWSELWIMCYCHLTSICESWVICADVCWQCTILCCALFVCMCVVFRVHNCTLHI